MNINARPRSIIRNLLLHMKAENHPVEYHLICIVGTEFFGVLRAVNRRSRRNKEMPHTLSVNRYNGDHLFMYETHLFS